MCWRESGLRHRHRREFRRRLLLVLLRSGRPLLMLMLLLMRVGGVMCVNGGQLPSMCVEVEGLLHDIGDERHRRRRRRTRGRRRRRGEGWVVAWLGGGAGGGRVLLVAFLLVVLFLLLEIADGLQSRLFVGHAPGFELFELEAHVLELYLSDSGELLHIKHITEECVKRDLHEGKRTRPLPETVVTFDPFAQ